MSTLGNAWKERAYKRALNKGFDKSNPGETTVNDLMLIETNNQTKRVNVDVYTKLVTKVPMKNQT